MNSNNNEGDLSFLTACWFEHITQQNRLLTEAIRQTNANLSIIDSNLRDQRLSSITFMERFLQYDMRNSNNNSNSNNSNNNNNRNSNNNSNIIRQPTFQFNSSLRESGRNNIFRSDPIWRFPPPPPPPSRWPQRRNRTLSRRNRISNIIHESINRLNVGNSTFSNVPTSLQIHDSTTNCKWRDIKNSTDQEICPITQQNFNDNDDVLKINHCGHIFKKDSLVTWFERSSLCPVCRHNITTSTDTSNNIINPINEIISSLNDISRNNFILDVSFDVMGTSPINMFRNTTNTSTNTDTFSDPDISNNRTNHK